MKNYNRTFALAASLALIGWMSWYFSDIVLYLCLAWVLSMIGQPLVRFFLRYGRIGKWNIGPAAAAVLTLLTYLGGLFLMIWLFLPPIIEQVGNLTTVDYRAVARTLEEPLLHLQEELAAYGLLPPGITLEEQFLASVSGRLEPRLVGSYLSSLFSAAGDIGVGLASVLFISFFFLQEQGMFASFVAALLPEAYERQVRQAIHDIAGMLSRYFRGLLVQMLTFTLLVTLGLYLVGARNALLIGFMAGLLNVIPYVGPIIGAAFGALFTVSSHLEADFYGYLLPLLGKVAAVFLAAQLFDNYVAQPKIFSSSVMAHPLEIFIIVLVGAKVRGVTGMVLAIPAYTVLRAVALVFLGEVHVVRRMKERMQKMRSGNSGNAPTEEP
ncbi:MAG: hypothetical protein RLY31_1754 [Bacteroidota bacterium]|jgi:predicted PurR-regulated permease PerM